MSIAIAQQKTVSIPEKPEAKAIPEMLTVQEAAQYLGIKPQTLASWRCTRRYDLLAVKIGKRLRYRKSDLDNFIKRRTNGGGSES